MNFQKQSQANQQKSWKILEVVWSFIDGIHKKVSEIYESSPFSYNFYRKYRNTSLAILNNFQSIQQAVLMSQEYEVPLLCINIRNEQEEDKIWKSILNNFQNSQLLNQGFLLWISYRKRKGKFLEQKQEQDEGFVECYQQKNAFKIMKIKQLPQADEEIYKMLFDLRNEYYQLEQKDEKIRESQTKKVNQQLLVNSSSDQKKQQNNQMLINEGQGMGKAHQEIIQQIAGLNQLQLELEDQIQRVRQIIQEKQQQRRGEIINIIESRPKEVNPQKKNELDKNLKINYNEFGEYPQSWNSEVENIVVSENEAESRNQNQGQKKKQE